MLESELEALLIEAELIRTYQPNFNILLKDDKSPLYIHITDDKFPRVLRVRKKNIIKYKLEGTVLGPFSSAYKTEEVLKIARKIFPWCNKKLAAENTKGEKKSACFYYHLDQCPGSCVGLISKEEYAENIKQLILFLKGKKQTVTKNLKRKMKDYSQDQEYEKAAVNRDQLQIIEEVTKGTHRLKPELTTQALKNKVSEDGLIYLQKILSSYSGLPKTYPLDRIEGYDVSNIQGTNPAVAMVTFIDGVSNTDEYRLFNIRSLNTPNDYQMMKEAIARRQNNPQWGTPNLIVIDGGKGQVRASLKVWSWNTPIIGIAKNPDRLVLPKIDWIKWASSEDKQSMIKGLEYDMVKLAQDHPSLKLIQQIRDEAHRFSQKQHKKKRLKGMFQ